MAEPNPNMLEIAKKLIPDIEENMPASVREAFETGNIKSIFRTGGEDISSTGKRFAAGSGTRPSSHYFLLDDGRAARYGVDESGVGWMGARASAPDIVMNQDDPFVFDNILFGTDKEDLQVGKNLNEAIIMNPEITSDPVVGKNIYEVMSEDGIITRSHGGNSVKDIYRRDGTATFFEDAADPIRGIKPNLVTSTIEDLDFVERTGKAYPVRLPRMKSGAPPLTPKTSPSPAPTPSTGRLRRNQSPYWFRYGSRN
jgi:hypothetical protein